MSLVDQIREAGVVGAGGAGFPTHVKAGSSVEYVVANGAECEPLLHKDSELMAAYPAEIVEGLRLMVEATGASKGLFGVKKKNAHAVKALEGALSDARLGVHLLGDYYPTGDEYELVHSATGRLIPPLGIPLQVGCVVDNVETLFNVARAAQGQPVVDKFVSVCGAVQEPVGLACPVGTSFRDLLEAAGGPTVDDFALFVSGVMMGKLSFDLDQGVKKTLTGLIVLPRDHRLVYRLERPERAMHKIGKSACDQCSYCTEFCPRYLLGYDVQPHRVMRSLGFTRMGEELWNQHSVLCCECGLCSLYACPEDLYPREACQKGKRDLKAKGIKFRGQPEVRVHPMHKGRRVPLKGLVQRLGLTQYDVPAPFCKDRKLEPEQVTLLLNAHLGAPAQPVVEVGATVRRGQLVAEIPAGKLGARVHASLDGTVSALEDNRITIRR
ncbi:MAG: NADH dehydrogenase subunit [Armatimonadetes bacterium CG_4_10_14_3_um_filter_66_18]|nr:NADH dehydrogenase subunit [Armatimonadota bacterium]PIU92716.1 MAG: NADH dehydrogenase subunit [Armatimonadetes bacterium CG06_land_8_20_14_3_00_66_21]PIX45162.1 MAG: NADH dehydrogenase subunit [Armatimonadetes bacterium CG_4_8_14_3_um_filter_66_20]PIY54324.1 MAG: NADH dehydrogenase subunit [Armatimonadetes bacterium CG_4_10_14_3_um_filter_66_18]PIZ47881.1 MAG: NADH dehydrogenase subunit [Armatimonadetes bacterium CG_4_10_14_0_8_um_filter_66_14]PJB70720.1 MAG: NADH dehydrogenase subunit [A